MSNFSSIHFHTKRLYVHMFDTPVSYRGGLITLGSFPDKRKYSACDRYCVFTLWRRVEVISINIYRIGIIFPVNRGFLL